MYAMAITCWNDLVRLIKRTGWETSMFGDNFYWKRAQGWAFIKKSEEEWELITESVQYKGHYPIMAELNNFSPTDLVYYDVIYNDDIGINIGSPIAPDCEGE